MSPVDERSRDTNAHLEQGQAVVVQSEFVALAYVTSWLVLPVLAVESVVYFASPCLTGKDHIWRLP